MNKEEVYDRGFLNGAASISIIGLLFTALIDIRNNDPVGGYIIFGLVIGIKVVSWFLDMVKKE